VTHVDGSDRLDGAVLRAATSADIPELVQLARAFYDEDGFTTNDATLEENLQLLVPAPNARVTVAVKGGRTSAFALTTTGFTLESGLIAELQDLYVRPEDRRQGLASALIADAADWARARCAVLLELVVAPNGHDVSHLFRYYRERGFVDEDRRILSRPL
jgi:aminoglycoside 6'-N-acetyltransferase I